MARAALSLGTGDPRSRPKIKAIGIGGAGCNAISSCTMPSIALCGQKDQLFLPPNHRKVVLTDEEINFIRSTSPRLLGAVDLPMGRRLKEEVNGSDLVFLFTGLGGEAGSHVTPGLAHLCRRMCDLVMVSAALPFSVEGPGRRSTALRALPDAVDAAHMTVTYPNDGLLKVAPNLPLRKAFKVMDGIMMVPPQELAQVLTRDDLPRLRAELADAKHLRFGLGMGEGMRREEIAVAEAFSSPWFDFELSKVSAAIVLIAGQDLDRYNVKSVLDCVDAKVPEAKLLYGVRSDPALGERIRVTVLLASGL